MRSRVIQPRALFRIGGGAASAGSTASSAGAVGSNQVAAVAKTATSSANRSMPAALATRHASTCGCSQSAGISSLARTRPLRSSSSKGSSALAKAGARGTASSNSNTAEASTPSSASGTSASKANATASTSPFRRSTPVIPVHPPPHSHSSLALQAFFSQGRPLLEHNNIDATSPSSKLGSTADATSAAQQGRQSGAVAMVIDMSGDQAALSGASPLAERQEATEITHEDLEEAVQMVSDMLRKAKTPKEQQRQLMELRDEAESHGSYSLASLPSDLRSKIKEKAEALAASMDNIGSQLSELNLNQHASSPQILSLQYHLPSLASLTKASFDKILDNAVLSARRRENPLQMHTRISTMQAFEQSRRRLINDALAHAEDTTLASALGPESELVVLGEPEGPRAEWGRGVTSYLARHGRPFEPPAVPRGGVEAARTQRLEDMTIYEVEAQEQEDFKQVIELDASEDGYEIVDEGSPAANAASAGEAHAQEETPDVNMWLSHAMVQEKMKSSLDWHKTEAAMAGNDAVLTRGAVTSPLSSLHNLKKLNATLPAATIDALIERKRNELRRDIGTPGSESSSAQDVHMDSVKRKRKKKMRKMKYKKLRKRQRAERQRLKK